MQGKASDMKIVTDEILRLKSSLIDIYGKHTGMPADKIGKLIPLTQKYFKLNLKLNQCFFFFLKLLFNFLNIL